MQVDFRKNWRVAIYQQRKVRKSYKFVIAFFSFLFHIHY